METHKTFELHTIGKIQNYMNFNLNFDHLIMIMNFKLPILRLFLRYFMQEMSEKNCYNQSSLLEGSTEDRNHKKLNLPQF
ncbi:hypothetical protein BpHYR1_023009 [Brachionus plicatilis]|uniref:Uncharacterized protein n=1 Tax=Brachionus plicatilis TaxID=10195 RepID=A0A3M7QEW5_BRAPC|nr:hypothetical protein BpHYR1_023009 [Brachionus plicatilis]